MKNTVILLILLSGVNAASQNTEPEVAKELPAALDTLDIKPEYPGGMTAFLTFIMNNFVVPDNTAGGRVIIEFVVEKDGTTSEHKVVREPEPGLGDEALRVIKKAGNWKPGEQNGKRVRVRYSLPINVPKLN